MKIKIFMFVVSMALVLISCQSSKSNLSVGYGGIVTNDSYPTVVFFSHKRLGNKEGCSGVIVSPNVVLTAAHCFSGNVKIKKKDPNTGVESVVDGIDDLKECGITENGIDDKNLIRGSSFIVYNHIVTDSVKTRVKADKNGLTKNMPSKDLGAVIFDNVNGKAPFESIINRAKKKGVFFQLSKTSFKDKYIIDENDNLFFLGWGKYDKIKLQVGKKKQIGQNIACEYNSSTENFWKCFPKTRTENKQELEWGDSGGPLIYNNQILGFASKYNRNGSISMFASVTLGNKLKVTERFIKRVRDELKSKDLLESNSIFEELLK